MVQRKNVPPPKRRFWRVTPQAPQGEFVDAREVTAKPAMQPARSIETEPGWLSQSHEWTRGVEVTDESDSIRGELFDELFTKK